MVEYIPLKSSGRVNLIASSNEFTNIKAYPSEVDEWLLWMEKYAIEVTSLIENSKIKLTSHSVDLDKWFERNPNVVAYLTSNFDEYIMQLKRKIGSVIEGKKVVLSYSGGKDSTVALITLLKLSEHVNFKLHVVYVHMPYLEPTFNLKFIDKVSSKLGVEIEVLSPPRWIMRKYLKENGLPYRRARWCTYLKTRPLKEFKRKMDINYTAIGDRVWEAGKRFSRLFKMLLEGRIFKGKNFMPIAPMTILDVARIVKSYNLVHPDYLKGLTRVSCYYCPYKCLYEFYAVSDAEVEDVGFIDSILKFEWRKWYSKYVDYESFTKYHLWRYTPKIAKMFSELRAKIEESMDDYRRVPVNRIVELHRRFWTSSIDFIGEVEFSEVAKQINVEGASKPILVFIRDLS